MAIKFPGLLDLLNNCINYLTNISKCLMSSSDSERVDQDSIVDEIEEEVLKFNKIQRGHRARHKAGRGNNPEDQLYRQALKQFMFGKFQIAAQNCKKIISTHPENPEPYFLMANMHEEAGKKRNQINQLHKAVEFYFMHAYYSPPSIQKWIKVADLSFKLNMNLQAAYCYGRALKINNSSIEINLKRAEALEKCAQPKKAINIYKKILERVHGSLEVHKRYAKLRFKRKQYRKARQILFAYEGYQNDINLKFMICETYLKERKYVEEENFMIQNVFLETEEGEENMEEENSGKEVNLALFEDLPIQFIQMIYLCRLLGPFQRARETNQTVSQVILTPQLQEAYKSYYSEQKLRLFLLNYYQLKYEAAKSSPDDSQVIDQYNQLPQLYQEILSELENEKQLNSQYRILFLNQLIKYPAHQNVKNYLILTEEAKKTGNFSQAIKLLKEALKGPCQQSIEVKMEMNHIKALWNDKKGGEQKKKKMKKKRQIKMQRFDHGNNEAIFYSDDQENGEEKEKLKDSPLEEPEQEDSISNSFNQSDEWNLDSEDGNEKNKAKARKTKKISKPLPSGEKLPIDSSVTQKLLINTRETIQQIYKKLQLLTDNAQMVSERNNVEAEFNENLVIKEENHHQIKHCYHQMKECLEYLVHLQIQKQDNEQKRAQLENNLIQKRLGLVVRKKKRRRILGANSRIIKTSLIRKHSQIIKDCLRQVILFIKKCIILNEFEYVYTFTQMLSKSKFFNWHNKCLEFKQIKTQIYEIGVLACLTQNKFHKALFFCRFLVNRYSDSNFYLNIISYVMKINELNGEKVSLNSMINKRIVDSLNQESQTQIKQHTELIYLLGVQYMENCFFQLGIGMFLKVLSHLRKMLRENTMLEINCHLCISTSFLQIASSRTVFNKLDYVNRSAFAFKNYQQALRNYFATKDCLEKFVGQLELLFNQGRWYIFVKLYAKSIEYFTMVLRQIQNNPELQNQKIRNIKLKTAHNLIIIYRDIQQYIKAEELSHKYFTI